MIKNVDALDQMNMRFSGIKTTFSKKNFSSFKSTNLRGVICKRTSFRLDYK